MGKSKRAKQKRTVMRITSARRKQIQALAAALHPILPGSARNNGFSLKRIAKETNTLEFYKSQTNKQLTIEHYFTGVLRRYPRKPKLIVIRIVNESTVWMANKHRELTPEIRDSISDAMEALGFAVRNELNRIQQPPFEKISIPGDDLRILFDRLELHPILCKDIKTLFIQGHANDAVRRATELFEKHVKDISNNSEQFGIKLMEHVFNEKKPIIKINKFENSEQEKEQKGYKYLGMGLMGCVRNKYSHSDAEQIDFLEAFKLLCFISYMLEKIDNEKLNANRVGN